MNYKHNCKNCKFLGSFFPTSMHDQSYAKVFDLYLCKKESEAQLKARYGNAPEEYLSAIYNSLNTRPSYYQTINEAYVRARAKKK